MSTQKAKAGFVAGLVLTTLFAGPAFGWTTRLTDEINTSLPTADSASKTCPNAVSAEEAGVEFRKYEYKAKFGTDPEQSVEVILKFDDVARRELSLHPVEKGLDIRSEIAELKKKGAVQNNVVDGNCDIIPAKRVTWKEARPPHIETSYQIDGRALDLANGDPAYQLALLSTGEIIKAQSCRKDRPCTALTEEELYDLNVRKGHISGEPDYGHGEPIPNAMMPK